MPKMDSRARVTLPRNVRERLNLKPGDEVDFFGDSLGIRVRKHATNPFAKYRGYLTHLAGRDPDELVAELRDD